MSGFRRWFNSPVLHEIRKLGDRLMSAVDDLNAAIAAQYDAILPALSDVNAELTRVRDLLANGASSEEVAAALANVNASTNRIKTAVQNMVDDSSTPDPGEDNPGVDEPLPEEPVEV